MANNITNNLFSRSNLGVTSIWLALFLTFGYPLSVSIPVLLHLPSEAINISFRIVYVLLSIYIIVGTLSIKEKRVISIGGLFILLFWVPYSIRLIYDISFKGIIFNSPFYVYSFAFGNCLLPSIAIILSGKFINTDQLKRAILIFLILVNIVTLILLIYSSGGLSLESLSQRAMISDSNDDSKSMLNAIIISQTGEFLAVISFAQLVLNGHGKKILLFSSFLLGIFNLMIGASRGPMLSFAFCAILILFIFFSRIKITYARLAKIAAWFITILIFYFTVISSLFESANITIFVRLMDLYDGGQGASLDDRPLLFKSAWNQFLSSPIIGDQYLSIYGNYYPHNIFLEILMSLGLTGAFIFLGVLVFSFRKASILFKGYNDTVFIPFILLITILLAGMTSGCLFAGVGLWTWLSLFNSIKFK
ncbi:MAG: O-antigen ligase family protein [Bacteroidota bacterium]|nr:O-antigen ligase family protein [Bacteroidota bacterium]